MSLIFPSVSPPSSRDTVKKFKQAFIDMRFSSFLNTRFNELFIKDKSQT